MSVLISLETQFVSIFLNIKPLFVSEGTQKHNTLLYYFSHAFYRVHITLFV